MNRFASTRSEKRARQPGPGRAQCRVGSIEDEGILYGFTTHALIASTIATAPMIVAAQSMTTRHPRGRPSVSLSTGFLTPCEISRVQAPGPALLAPPVLDPFVIAGQQHIGDAPAAKLGRARVVRVLEPAFELGREALDARRLLAPGAARQQPRDRIDDDRRRQLSARENIAADRECIGAQ